MWPLRVIRCRSFATHSTSAQGENMKFNVVNLGCKVNRIEADNICASYLAAGHELVPQEDADLIIVNTCTVTAEADKKARKAARHALNANKQAHVIVTGCAASIKPEDFASLDPRVRVKEKVSIENETGLLQPHSSLLRLGDAFRTRVNIKIQDGCDHACTYCIVHVARGDSYSIDADEVVNQVASYAKFGVKEVVLAGINLAAYRSGDAGLAALCKRILAACDHYAVEGEPPCRIRISSVEPDNLDEETIDAIADSDGRICRHLHLPLQSGSSKVLGEMDRCYNAEEFMALVERIRSAIPQIALSTDIIVGFPGETEEDFAQTIEVARACGFSKIHVFPYSMREGTPAAQRPDQVDAEVKKERARILRELSDELRGADFDKRKGTSEYALVETKYAMSESYYELPIPEGAKQGDLVCVTLDRRVGA